MPYRILLLTIVLILTVSAPGQSAGKFAFPGQVSGKVVRVIDGDTLKVRADIWVNQQITINVRLAGIDAPELKSRCRATRIAARRARDEVVRLVAGRRVRLTQIRAGKYYCRGSAQVETDRGNNLSAHWLRTRLASPYQGRRKCRQCDCPTPDSQTSVGNS